jgi:hypothetical protein
VFRAVVTQDGSCLGRVCRDQRFPALKTNQLQQSNAAKSRKTPRENSTSGQQDR